MAWLALGIIVIWLAVLGVGRAVIHARAGGEPAVRFADAVGSAQWWARLLGTVGFLFLILAPIADLAGLPPLPLLDRPPLRLAGAGVALVGILGAAHAQAALGPSWRGDVDPEARTALVTTGPYRWVRNPIFTWTAVTSIGIGLLVPNLLALAMVVANLASHQVLVRLVEEPYLRSVHGDRYAAYAARTGRFLPGIGRERP
jgi:protein-S-isoprenylcysteine O-methyltransferase Ste14